MATQYCKHGIVHSCASVHLQARATHTSTDTRAHAHANANANPRAHPHADAQADKDSNTHADAFECPAGTVTHVKTPPLSRRWCWP